MDKNKRSVEERKNEFLKLRQQIINCKRCPGLVEWRKYVSDKKTRRFSNQEYWGKPVPSFGDPNAELLIAGIAPAAHGENRTGRAFTGDRTGDLVYRTLHRFGFANQPISKHIDDGLQLYNCIITAICRCVPPGNKPTREEIINCRPYLLREFELLNNLNVIVTFGKIAFEATVSTFIEAGNGSFYKRPIFKHGGKYSINDRITIVASYHPSQQNIFTGKMSESMLNSIFQLVCNLLDIKE